MLTFNDMYGWLTNAKLLEDCVCVPRAYVRFSDSWLEFLAEKDVSRCRQARKNIGHGQKEDEEVKKELLVPVSSDTHTFAWPNGTAVVVVLHHTSEKLQRKRFIRCEDDGKLIANNLLTAKQFFGEWKPTANTSHLFIAFYYDGYWYSFFFSPKLRIFHLWPALLVTKQTRCCLWVEWSNQIRRRTSSNWTFLYVPSKLKSNKSQKSNCKAM